MQLNFSAPKGVALLLKRTCPTGTSLSRHILVQVMDGLLKNFPAKKRRK